MKIYVPCDAGALAMGADAVARAIERQVSARRIDAVVVRNGSRGMFWLEPLVEVETPHGRVAYGPVSPEAVDSLFNAGFLQGKEHALCLGLTEEIPYLRAAGAADVCPVRNHRSVISFRLRKSRRVSWPAARPDAGARGHRRRSHDVGTARTRRRGLSHRHQVANGSGSQGRPEIHRLQRRRRGQRHIRGSHDHGRRSLRPDRRHDHRRPRGRSHEGLHLHPLRISACVPDGSTRDSNCARAGYLGANVAGSGKSFDLEVRLGAGAYICGEETSLLESLEGKRGQIRYKPPLPAIEGLFGKPTVVNNVISLATVPIILDKGAEHYRDFGMGRSRGTLTIQLAGNIKLRRSGGEGVRPDAARSDLRFRRRHGVGTTVARGAGRADRWARIFRSRCSIRRSTTKRSPAKKGLLGHGGIVVFDDTVDLARQARFAMEFCAIESCGKCTPCRIGVDARRRSDR